MSDYLDKVKEWLSGDDECFYGEVEKVRFKILVKEVERLREVVLIQANKLADGVHVVDLDAGYKKQINRAEEENQRLRSALEPFAKLDLPKKPQGNAGMWTLLHKDIRKAKQALGDNE